MKRKEYESFIEKVEIFKQLEVQFDFVFISFNWPLTFVDVLFGSITRRCLLVTHS